MSRFARRFVPTAAISNLIDIEGNTVIVAFRGMCAQCKMAEVTMKDVVQAKLREFVCDDIFVEEQKEPGPEHKHREVQK